MIKAATMILSVRYIFSIILIVFLAIHSTHAIASHFRGGGFTWTMIDDDAMAKK